MMTQVTTSPLIIRTMTRADLDRALEWAVEEGWNPGIHDAACFHATDPAGFLVGEIDGEVVGCIAAIAYSSDFGWIGLYIVRPEYRGRGYGISIWNAGMAHLAQRTIGLDGVIAQEANYTKSGFRTVYRDVRFEGVGGGASPSCIVELADLSFNEVLAYDGLMFPSTRSDFLRCWIRSPGGAALGIRRDGRLVGYGVLRACHRGFRIAPLLANDAAIAEDLFAALASRAAGSPVFLDVPEANPAAVALARRHGMHEMFSTVRMYTRNVPNLPLGQIFGVTSMEVG